MNFDLNNFLIQIDAFCFDCIMTVLLHGVNLHVSFVLVVCLCRVVACLNRPFVCIDRSGTCLRRSGPCLNRSDACLYRSDVCLDLSDMCLNLLNLIPYVVCLKRESAAFFLYRLWKSIVLTRSAKYHYIITIIALFYVPNIVFQMLVQIILFIQFVSKSFYFSRLQTLPKNGQVPANPDSRRRWFLY